LLGLVGCRTGKVPRRECLLILKRGAASSLLFQRGHGIRAGCAMRWQIGG
jgi:hypothetical protein